MTPSGQSVNQSVYKNSICRMRVVKANKYHAEENAAIY